MNLYKTYWIAIISFSFCQGNYLIDDIIRIGKFTYTTKKSTEFLKGESYNCKWLSLFSKNGEHQAGLIVEAIRNDTLFVSGTYRIESNRFIVKNYYHFRHQHEPDSSIKIFVQDTRGKL